MSNPTLTGLVFALDLALAKVPLHDDGIASALRALCDALPRYEATLALARFGAAVLGDTSEPGCLDGADIQAMANNAGVLVLHRPPAGLCHTGQPRGESCSCCEYYGMDEEAECYVEAPGIRDAIARLTGGEA